MSRKIRYMLDSIYAFTDIPLKMISLAGVLGMVSAVLYGMYVFIARLSGVITDAGFAATIIAVLFMGGLNAFAIGVVGSYAWRIFENTKQRPISVVASTTRYTEDGVATVTADDVTLEAADG